MLKLFKLYRLRNFLVPVQCFRSFTNKVHYHTILQFSTNGSLRDNLPTQAIWNKLHVNGCSGQPTDEFEINYEQLKSRLQNVVLIDVREIYELEENGRYPSAINIPLGDLWEALEMSPDKFRALYGTNQPDFHDEIVFACQAGVRSLRALTIARQHGFDKSKHYPGGYSEWIEKSSETCN